MNGEDVFVVTRPNSGGKFRVYRRWPDVEDEFDSGEPGTTIHVTYQNMTPEEIEALPDFEGW
jgi:hypothetical protein